MSPQETSIPEELLVTVVKPGLPTLADLHVLLPPARPTRKRSLTSDKVSPAATGPGPPHAAEGLVVIPGKHGDLSLPSWRKGLSLTNHCPSSPLWLPQGHTGGGVGGTRALGRTTPQGDAPLSLPFHWLELVTLPQPHCEG